MKYAIVIPDGAADVPLESLGGRTPLQAARKPHMDWIASNGKLGTVRTVPRNMECGSDVAILSVLGYDPRQYYTGRAPLEAAARGLEVGQDEWAFRCNLVTITDGQMQDHSAGHISTEEATALVAELNRIIGGERIRFYPGVSYRNLMVLKGEVNVTTTGPHDILGQPIEGHLPTGPGSDILTTLIARSQSILAGQEVNQVRRDLNENPATHIWLWGQGKMPHLPNFQQRFGLTGTAITAVDLVRGIARLIGWDHVDVPGATGFVDTNYAGKGEAAVKALATRDLVCVHIEATDEAGHQGDIKGKVHALEQIDTHIVGPILRHFQEQSEPWRLMVLPDHPTPCARRTHTHDPVPFAIAGEGFGSAIQRPYSEQAAAQADLHIDRGDELMEYFLKQR